MGELIRRSFGDAINYDDLTDPDVRRLVFLSHSPSGKHRKQLQDAIDSQDERPRLRRLLYVLDLIDSQEENIPGTYSCIHRQWVKSLPYFNPLTYEFQLPEIEAPFVSPEPPEPSSAEIIQLGSAVHSQARRVLDTPEDGSGRVLPFPSVSGQSDGFYSPPPISA